MSRFITSSIAIIIVHHILFLGTFFMFYLCLNNVQKQLPFYFIFHIIV